MVGRENGGLGVVLREGGRSRGEGVGGKACMSPRRELRGLRVAYRSQACHVAPGRPRHRKSPRKQRYFE